MGERCLQLCVSPCQLKTKIEYQRKPSTTQLSSWHPQAIFIKNSSLSQVSGSSRLNLRCSQQNVPMKTEEKGDPELEKTTHHDSWLDLAFINGCRGTFGRVAGWQSPRSWEEGYLGMVEVSHALMRGRNAAQQQAAVLQGFPKVPKWFRKLFPYTEWGAQLNARATPAFFEWLVGPCEVIEVPVGDKLLKSGVQIKKCRYLETSGCTGMCVNLCKVPTQYFFTSELGNPQVKHPGEIPATRREEAVDCMCIPCCIVTGNIATLSRMPLTMEPNFEDMSCRMIFGQNPPQLKNDPALQQGCFSTCPSSSLETGPCPKLR